jgi:ubiquinone/menaquinone biosynthesis C-methylase UbiE
MTRDIATSGLTDHIDAQEGVHQDVCDWSMRGMVEIRGRHVTSTQASLAAYDGLHAAGHLVQRDSFYKWLVSLLDPLPDKMLLDVSCGQGGLLRFAAAARLTAFGLDLSPTAIKKVVQRVSELGTKVAMNVGDAERLPYGDDTFDYVTNIGSLEHYLRPWWAVREMSRVLKPEGLACILLPNTFGLLGNILYVWRTGDVFDDGQPLQRYGTPRQWQNLLEENGLHIVRALKYEREWPRTWADLYWYCLHPHKLVRVMLSALIPLNLSSFLVFLCCKAS